MTQSAGPTPSARRKARRFVLQGLYEWQLSGNAAHEIEARYRVENAMHKVDLDYFHELIHEITKTQEVIDDAFMPHLDRKFHELDHVERRLSRALQAQVEHDRFLRHARLAVDLLSSAPERQAEIDDMVGIAGLLALAPPAQSSESPSSAATTGSTSITSHPQRWWNGIGTACSLLSALAWFSSQP